MDPAEGRESGGVDPHRRIDRDRTAVSRIRDAALSEFAAHGVARATMRSVAEAAGVSAQLVVHHFGSKEGLAAACDEHVLQLFREHNVSLLGSGSAFAPVESLEAIWLGPAMGYLAARLVDDSPAVSQLVDEAVEDAISYLAEGEESGVVEPSEFPRERAAVVLLWNLGALVLHRHAKRLIDVDLLASDPRQLLTWTLPASEMLTGGLFSQKAYDRLRTVAADDATAPPPRSSSPRRAP